MRRGPRQDGRVFYQKNCVSALQWFRHAIQRGLTPSGGSTTELYFRPSAYQLKRTRYGTAVLQETGVALLRADGSEIDWVGPPA